MRSTRDCAVEAEDIKAAGAWSEALRRLSPPRLLGREAFCHDHEGIGPPRMASKDDLITESNSPVALEIWLGGQVRRVYESLGRARHERRRAVSS